MQPTKLSTDGERPDDDPYAPPRAGASPEVDETETDQVGNQRKKHLRRESCIRIAGIFGLILAGYAVLTFVLVPLSELYDPESLGEEGIVPWMFQRWVARSICDILIAVLAFVTSWGLSHLRNWGPDPHPLHRKSAAIGPPRSILTIGSIPVILISSSDFLPSSLVTVSSSFPRA